MAETGRPKITIDWSVVDKLLVSGSSGIQVSAYLGVHHDTLYDRCVADFGKSFSDYTAEKRAKGDSMLLGKQFESAISGNTTMLIWLGKVRLDQKERIEHTVSEAKTLMDQIKPSAELVHE